MRFYIVIFAVMAVLLTGCAKRADWHQKMVLYFDTPDGPVTASSVTRVDVRAPIDWLGGMDFGHIGITGEAVVADLGGRYLFALLDEGAGRLIWLTMRSESKNVPGFKDAIREVERQTKPLDVPPNLWPRMVTFENIEDPTSIQLVNPDELADRFDAGYELHRLTIQVTKEPLTGGVESVLRWLPTYNEWLKPIDADLDQQLISPFDFKTELRK